MTAKVEVDEDTCTACGLCYNDECPEVFEEGEDGISSIKEKYRKGDRSKGEVPDEEKACAEQAADACPVSAITVE